MSIKDSITKSEIKFWFAIIIPIIGGVTMTMGQFYALKMEVVEAKRDIVTIRDDISEIKLSLAQSANEKVSSLIKQKKEISNE